ncbi:SDR family NAD(P)-dependent oxidoreductase [Alisedimentitalea sp. MJ-SS2]|uniref:SDR family NAD(P)-dependent oxidoreductase n=1 Tax=Aliisedimentitalea sp. MJ-SS2 TaxID=3049795 RepID=UPI0029081441|nr:SDR family NAD(P)-dependent oxidoreductase [Alisedimentitalea sp. MJ-SS2]MDU8926735.1 SDR family NAD(P)-dependent oxidoreductase [Alisedimentitalea sp. MJ-SS2]
MTERLKPPPRKNPQKRTVSPTSPPAMRSRASLGISAAAAEGRFMLQVCGECHAVQYPARDACCKCLSVDLPWQDVDPAGQLLAETTIRTSTNLYFRERSPWRTGSVKLDAGPVIIAHVHGDVERGARVRLENKLDRSGQGVLLAMPEERSPDMEDDPQLRAMSSDPKLRRVLIADGRNSNAVALAQALAEAGTSMIFVGESESWRPNPNRSALEKVPGVEMMALDVTDTSSVRELAGEIGGKTDILINNARFVRPGGVLERGDTAFAHDEMEVNYLGLMRLAQAFGPGMCGRTADGVNSAVAWVNVISAYALVNASDYGCFSASNAAAFSLSQSLRAEFRASGLRLMNVFVGPTEDDWHQPLPPPKVMPKALARDVVKGLRDGLEDVYCGDVAKDLRERFMAGPKILEREMTGGGA